MVNEVSRRSARERSRVSTASETCCRPAVHTVAASRRRRTGQTSFSKRYSPAAPSASPRTRRRSSDGRLCSSGALEVGKLSGWKGEEFVRRKNVKEGEEGGQSFIGRKGQ